MLVSRRWRVLWGRALRLRRDGRRCDEKIDLALEFFPFCSSHGSVAVGRCQCLLCFTAGWVPGTSGLLSGEFSCFSDGVPVVGAGEKILREILVGLLGGELMGPRNAGGGIASGTH